MPLFLLGEMCDTKEAPSAAEEPPAPPPVNEEETTMSEAERKRLQKKREEQELFHELWPRETKDQITYSVQVDDVTTIDLPITQDLMARRFNDAIGNIVWDAAVGMHHYFKNREHFPQGYWKGLKVLELGAGTGLVGFTLTALGAEVYLTDLPVALPILHHNVTACFPATVLQAHGLIAPKVEALSWGVEVEPEGRREYDVVVGSDITYDVDKCPLLLRTLHDVCTVGRSVGYIGHLERGSEDVFFDQMVAQGFSLTEVYKEDTKEDSVARAHWVHVFRIEKKARGREGKM